MKQLCTCHPRALLAHDIKWLEGRWVEGKKGMPDGWYVRTGGAFVGYTWLPMVGACLMCRGRIWERPRPIEWLESEEYLAEMAVRELHMDKWQGDT